MRKAASLRLYVICLVPLTLILLTIPSSAKITADPGQKGPYEVGFTFFVLKKSLRQFKVVRPSAGLWMSNRSDSLQATETPVSRPICRLKI